MTPKFQFRRLQGINAAEFAPMRQESKEQGYNFVGALIDEYLNGVNRFDQPGEALFAVYNEQGDLIGVGGLNCDPYLTESEVGRVRHIYVLADFRRLGVGAKLMDVIIAAARRHFVLLRLRTMTREAAKFYESLGFAPIQDESATHILPLSAI